jgi:hypothetical protein
MPPFDDVTSDGLLRGTSHCCAIGPSALASSGASGSRTWLRLRSHALTTDLRNEAP